MLTQTTPYSPEFFTGATGLVAGLLPAGFPLLVRTRRARLGTREEDPMNGWNRIWKELSGRWLRRL